MDFNQVYPPSDNCKYVMAHELQSCGHDNIQGFFKISFHSLIDSVAPSLSMEFSVLLG